MTQEKLRGRLLSIDGRGYPAYKQLRGKYRFPFFTLFIDYVQGDPFASPSCLRIVVDAGRSGFPESTFKNKSRRIALCDFLTRRFAGEAEVFSEHRGSGNSGLLSIALPGNEVLERSSVFVRNGEVEARFKVGLPARGRNLLGLQAADMLCNNVASIAENALLYEALDKKELQKHLDCVEDADIARRMLKEKKLSAFVADGSILPRRSGIDQEPMRGDRVVPFKSPETLSVTLDLPHSGQVSGMGVPVGVTLIAGGGYHGKSTLLRALERGVYDHVPGDGRELVVTDPTAFKIRAEDGRSIEKVDISAFVSNLPDGTETTSFSTENASGSTSQAANIIEAIESGSTLLLLDEDTCATNFMIRDRRMQELVEKTGEPITPFIDRVRDLYEKRSVSTILVMGGSGDYFEVSDIVILMDKYCARDVTARAGEIAREHDLQRLVEMDQGIKDFKKRIPVKNSINAGKGRHIAKISVRNLKTLIFGENTIDVDSLEQIVEAGQLLAIGQALHTAKEKFMEPGSDLFRVAIGIDELIGEKTLDAIDSRKKGDYVRFRKQELLAVLNRLRTLEIKGLRQNKM